MKLAIVGGKLQGVEASFLADSLGWDTILIDKDPNVPARGLAHSFVPLDVIKDRSSLIPVIRKVDLVIPTLENVAALKVLQECSKKAGVPLAYDEKAHIISRSKKRSNRFFRKCGLPVPLPWPNCGLPVIAKPSNSSGSRGVSRIDTEAELASFLNHIGPSASRWVVEEYLDGPSFSLEVFGFEGRYETAQVTELEMDEAYDCKRVLAPARIPHRVEEGLREMTLTLARELRLNGIMDVEVIEQGGMLKVLEIDARLPSQTPAAVLNSTEVNMLQVLADIYCRKFLPRLGDLKEKRGVVYEQIQVKEEGIDVLGEHVMVGAGPLRKIEGFFGADVALTNFEGPKFPWVATLIVTGEDLKAAWAKRCRVLDNIEREPHPARRPRSIGNDTTQRRTAQEHRQRIRSV